MLFRSNSLPTCTLPTCTLPTCTLLTYTSEAWEGVAGKSTGGKGLAGASKAWEGPQEGRKSFTDRSEAWEGLREGRKSFVSRSEAWKGPQRGSRTSSGINKETRRKLRRGKWGKPTPVIFALPLPFWNDWNVPLPVLPNTYRYRLERSMERSRVEHRQACLTCIPKN